MKVQKRSDTVFITTAFPQPENATHSYFNSLKNQTSDDFDILIVNDGVVDLESQIDYHGLSRCIVLSSAGNIAQNRYLMINSAKELGYKKAIFGDFDDYFSENRVQVVSKLLDEFPIVVNDVSLVFDDSELLDRYFEKEILYGKSFYLGSILDVNFAGFSNSAIRLELYDGFSFPDELVAVDWYFFTRILMKNVSGCFDGEALTYYRQHAANLANIRDRTRAQLENEINVKKLHYKALSTFSDEFAVLYKEIAKLQSDFYAGKFNRIFEDEVSFMFQSRFWWSLIPCLLKRG